MRKGTRSVWPLMVAAVLVVGMAASAAAAFGSHQERPLEATVEATFEVVVDADWCEPPWIGVTLDITEGHATHMGRITGEGRHCVNGPVFDYGVVVLVAANGDELYGTYSGQFLGEEPDGTVSVLSFEEYEGGTGRFANAVGSAVNVTSAVFLTEFSGVMTGESTGTLAYNASDRSR